MPRRRTSSSIKDPEMYEAMRREGASKEQAARVSNAASREGRSAVGRRGGRSHDYDEWTVDQLRRRARDLGLHQYSRLRKTDLIDLIRHH